MCTMKQWYEPGYVKNICDKIWQHHETVYISRYDSLQLYCFDPFRLHKNKISKGTHKTDSELVAILKVKLVPKLC